ncbi:helicase RepA family protein [Enterobacter cloacae complex sp. IR5378]|uniref:helicase RepA family protein n=1 Tax=Enterobacter cloacae complex TaxID=354276 RepID=UPI002075E6FE|nr:helicase RepA family protein [Enterobacter hormaechei]MCM7731644.1 helicase RepA family protein [Enterobacter hormaechei]MCW4756001.1 helicase RepA family protein [Enterobacter hormaechei]UAS93941.1 helicase RepA family protein [Enterobacter cloacae complex sp.]
MTVQLTAVETASDALFACSYLWAHGRPYARSDLDKAIHQHKDPTTRYGKLVAKLTQLHSMTYEELCEAGYLGSDAGEVNERRRAVLIEEIGEDELKTWLTDAQRVQRVFPSEDIQPRRTRLPLTRGSEGYDARQDFVIKHFLPAQSLCSIYGPSGSYKSFLAVSWACHIAAGMAWAGKKVAPGAVLYVVGEGGVGVPRRVKAWEMMHSQRADNLYLVNRPVFPVRSSEVNEVLLAAREVEAECGLPVRMVVIDTLARCFGGNDENDARDMGAFIEGCDVIKQKTGATVLVVHHSGKDEAKGARGSSSFRAALDAEYNVKREGENPALILSCTKMKDAEEPERKAYDLCTAELYSDEDGEKICSLVVRDVGREVRERDPELAGVEKLSDNHMALWQAIRSRIAQGEPCNRAIIRDDLKATGINIKHFTRWLQKLIDDGLVIQDGDSLAVKSIREVGN